MQFYSSYKSSLKKLKIKFYRKRLITLFKELLKGEEEREGITRELKEAHDSFITKAINYFQVMDTKDIIQGQHLKDAAETNESTLSEADGVVGLAQRAAQPLRGNEYMMRKTVNVASLDNYVIAKHDISSNDMRIIPVKINIDLKTADLRVKGVKPKLKKVINKQEATEATVATVATEATEELSK